MIDTSQQDSNPPTPQAALVSTVSFRDLKKIRPLNPTSPDDLKELLRIVSHLTSLFTYENAHWQILPNQKIVLPLLFSPQDEELYTTDQPRNSRTVTNPERTLFGTDIATMLAQVANQLQLNGFVDQQSVIHYLDEVASQGNPGQYSEEQLYKELHRIVDFGNFLSGQLRIRLQTITQETESTAEEKTEVETTPPEPDQPKTQETATAKVAGQRQSSDDTGGGESSEETDNLTTEQKNELKATADHDRRALLISYEGLLANTASFLAAAQGNFSIDDLSETQRAYFLNEARAFIKERYGDTIPKLSFAERRKMVREFQIKMLGSVAGAFDTKAEFEKGLKNVLGRDDTGLNKTIENSISAMVQASGPKAIIEMLEHLDTNDSKLLAQILGITENLSPEQYAQLKNIVLSYTQCHASELTLVAADKELFARFEAVAPNLADKGFQKQVDAFRSVIKNYNRASDTEEGATALTKALTTKGSDKEDLFNKAKNQYGKVQQYYGDFWRSLSLPEQATALKELSKITGEQFRYSDDPAAKNPIPLTIYLLPQNFFADLSKQISAATRAEAQIQAASSALTELQQGVLADQVAYSAKVASGLAALEQAIQLDPSLQMEAAELRSDFAAFNLRQTIVDNYWEQIPESQKQAIAQEQGLDPAQVPQQTSVLSLHQADERVTEQQEGGGGIVTSLRTRFGRKSSTPQGRFTDTIQNAGTEVGLRGLSAGAKGLLSAIPLGQAAALGIAASEKVIGRKKTWGLIAGGLGTTGIALLTSGGARLGALVGGSVGTVAGGAIGGISAAAAAVASGGALTIPALIAGVGGGAITGGAIGTGVGTFAGLFGEMYLNNAANAGTAAGSSAAPAATPRPTPQPTPTPKPGTTAPKLTPNQSPNTFSPAEGGPDPYSYRVPEGPTPPPVPDPGIAQALKASVSSASIATTAPFAALSIMFLMSFVTIFTIYSAFLVPLPGRAGGTGNNIPFLPGIQGCWPTTGTITVFRFYGPALGNGPHDTWDGSIAGFKGPGTAIDIGTSNNPPVFSPFAGKASFYPLNYGSALRRQLGNHVIVVTPNFALIFGHLNNFVDKIQTQDSSGNTQEVIINQTTFVETTNENIPIRAGQPLGNAGRTGKSTGEHLHYEVVGPDLLSILPLSDQERQDAVDDEKSLVNKFISPVECPNPATP